MFKLVFVIPIRASTCVYWFASPLGEVVNTAPVIFASPLLIYAFGLVGVVVEGDPVVVDEDAAAPELFAAVVP
jgi:hypothetical protein